MAKTCCAGNKPINTAPTEQKQDGDILAMALWHGNRIEYGIATRRKYPRLSYPKTAWVAPIDVAKSPRLWRALEPMVEPAPLVAQVQRFVGAAGLGQAFEVIRNMRRKPSAPLKILIVFNGIFRLFFG